MRLHLSEQATIVISRPDRIGDAVISSSCFEAVQKKYPSAKIYFLAQSKLKVLFENSKHLAGFISLSKESDLIHVFQKLKPHVIIHLNPHRDCYRAASSAQIPLRIGWEKLFLTRHLTHSLSDFRKQGKKHEAFYNFDLLKFLDIQSPETLHPEILPKKEALDSLSQKIPWDMEKKDFIVLNPTTARKIRRWPTRRFAELAKWISKDLNLKVVSIGERAADSVMCEFRRHTRAADILRMEGELDLAELAWLLQKSKMLVTCDTGPSHVAAAMKCPQVTIFGRTEPAYGPDRWRALDENVKILTPSIFKHFFETRRQFWRRGFENVSLDHVKNALKRSLAKEA